MQRKAHIQPHRADGRKIAESKARAPVHITDDARQFVPVNHAAVEKRNQPLATVVAAMCLGIAIVVAAAIHG